MRARVLVVEDVVEMGELISLYLEQEGIEVQTYEDAESALEALDARAVDLIVLDLNLPGMDGFQFLQRLRAFSSVPVIVVSARDADEDIILGLGVGADEFVTKPFSPKVLVARVRALLRRGSGELSESAAQRAFADGADDKTGAESASIAEPGNAAAAGAETSGVRPSAEDRRAGAGPAPDRDGPSPVSGQYGSGGSRLARFGPYRLDLDGYVLKRGSERVRLSPREFEVLRFLVENPGTPHTPEHIYDAVWDNRYGDMSSVGVYIQRLRRKIEEDPGEPRYIRTIRGRGYSFAREELIP